jgi:hypothetical protein
LLASTEVRSEEGTRAAIFERRKQIFMLGILLLLRGQTTEEVLKSFLGALSHPVMRRKICMCTLVRVYTWMNGLAEAKVEKIPADIWEELWAGIVHLPLAVTCLRAPVSCSDATTTSCGTVQA